jgi:hypothetical protein
MAFISYAAIDGLITQVNSINGGISILKQERRKMENSVASYRFVVDEILNLEREVGLALAKQVMDAVYQTLTSPYYRTNPLALPGDLKELIRRKREEQMLESQRQQQQKKEVHGLSKLNDEATATRQTSSASISAPTLPEQIEKREGASSDQFKEGCGDVSGGEPSERRNDTHPATIQDELGHHDSTQQNDAGER